jgi:hypothetical protein
VNERPPGGFTDVARLIRVALPPMGLCGLFLVACCGLFLVPGCSDRKAVPLEEIKINGMSPGEYIDSHDTPEAPKKARRGARTKPR